MSKQLLRGFTLVELAIVLIVVALLTGGLLMSLGAQRDVTDVQITEKLLAEAQEALLGFAAANGRLPCPASPGTTGVEDPSTGTGVCASPMNGLLPGATLGLSPTDERGYVLDPWGNPIRYNVATTTINGVTNPFTSPNGMQSATLAELGKVTLINVCASSAGTTATSCGTAPTLSTTAPVLLFSTGKNGAGTGADESANRDGNLVFVSHVPTAVTSAGGEFDDIVVWLSPNILYNRMIAAGRLP